MGWLSGIHETTVFKKVGFLFNNTLFNITASSGVILVSGTSCARALTKAFMSPFPTCKILGDCLDPSAGLTAKGADKCIDLATQLWS